jgi:pimeloyl-ACP methyl ester carboxylesterase
MEALNVDVTGAVGEPAFLSGAYYASSPSKPLLVCLPGGTYTQGYFDLRVPGYAGYSFAEHMVAKGFAVVTFDMLGTGNSTRTQRDIELGDQAAALAVAMRRLPAMIGRDGPFVCVGHSMGGYVGILQQASARSYAAQAILGTTNLWVEPLGLPSELVDAASTPAGRAAVMGEILAGMPERYLEPDRSPMLHWFHLDDVPPAVVEFDTATTATVVPRRCAAAASVPGVTRDEAALIDVPVFLAYGEIDVSPAPREEAAVFAASRDVTVYVLAHSAHCHNMASTRALIWDRMAAWCDAVAG